MSLVIDLRKHFTMAAVKQRLERVAVIQSTVMDLVFPPSARTQYDSPVIPVSEIRQLAHVMPVVARGAASAPITASEMDNQYVEPLPVRVHAVIKPVELNNLKLMGMGAREEWAGRKQEALRGSIKKTLEVLCAQAVFDGAISHPLLLASGAYADYSVTYGSTPQTYVPAAKWDAADFKLTQLYGQLEDMDTLLEEAGYAGERLIFAGKAAYVQALALAEAWVSQAGLKVEVSAEGARVGGYLIRKMAETYVHPATGVVTKKLGDKEIRMVAAGNHAFFYGPVDDLDANLQAMPMFIKPVKHDDPSDLKIVAESKPLPAPSPQAVVKATVLA